VRKIYDFTKTCVFITNSEHVDGTTSFHVLHELILLHCLWYLYLQIRSLSLDPPNECDRRLFKFVTVPIYGKVPNAHNAAIACSMTTKINHSLRQSILVPIPQSSSLSGKPPTPLLYPAMTSLPAPPRPFFSFAGPPPILCS